MRFWIVASVVSRARAVAGTLKPAQRPQDQRELAVGAELRMAAHEDHPQLVVPDHVLAERLPDRRRQRPLAVEVTREVGGERAPGALAADRVDRAVARGGEQPGRGVARDPGLAPALERRDERGLDDVLRELEVVRAEEPRQHRDQPPRFTSEYRLDLGVDGPLGRVNPLHHMLARRPR
jgi:hypothetical protein